MSVEIGDRVRDVVTTHEGVVIGITKWLTGCDSAMVQSGEIKDGVPCQSAQFDVNRLEVVKKAAVQIKRADTANDKGGPRPGY